MPPLECAAIVPPQHGDDGPPASPRPRRPSLMRPHLLGLGFLLLTVIPAYLASRAEHLTLAGSEEAVAAAFEEDTREIDSMEINAHITLVADRYGVPPRLVAAIIEAESEFNPRAVSRKGARGLMQLMPATATSLAVQDSFDPYANIEGGVRHLRRLMDRFHGDLPLVLAAYNAGEHAVVTYRGVPPYRETRRYVKRIMRRLGHPSVAPPNRTTLKRATTASPALERVSAAEILRAESALTRMTTAIRPPGRPSVAEVLRVEPAPPDPASALPPEPRPSRLHPRNFEGP